MVFFFSTSHCITVVLSNGAGAPVVACVAGSCLAPHPRARSTEAFIRKDAIGIAAAELGITLTLPHLRHVVRNRETAGRQKMPSHLRVFETKPNALFPAQLFHCKINDVLCRGAG